MVETAPLAEGQVFPAKGHVLAVGYWGQGNAPVVYDPAKHGLPKELYGAWIRHGNVFIDAVCAWLNEKIEYQQQVTPYDAPWVVRWAADAFRGRHGSRYQWAESVIGGPVYEVQNREIEYDVNLVGMIDWDEVANRVEHNDEIVFVFEDPRDRYSDVYAFTGPDECDPEHYREEWEAEVREAAAATNRPGKWMVKRTDASEATTVLIDPDEGNLGTMMVTVLSAVSQASIGINFDPINSLAAGEEFEVSLLVNGILYELVWHQE